MYKSKQLNLLIALVFMASFFVPIGTSAGVDIDQYCDDSQIENVSNRWLIKMNSPVSQTFKPSYNKLTSAILAIAGNGGSATIYLRVIDIEENDVIVTKSATAVPQISWVQFNFDDVVTLDTSKQYKLYVSTASNSAFWAWSEASCYANGNAIVNGHTETDQDFGFGTYGYGTTPPTVPADPPADDSGTTPDGSTSTQSSNSSTDKTEAKIAEVDESIKGPVLTSVLLNDKEITVSDAVVDTVAGDKLTLNGTTTKGTDVVVVFGLETHDATVDDEGIWTVEIPIGDSTDEEILVQGQTKKDDKGSELVDFVLQRLNLKK